jgi:hypothetical protein
MLEKLLCFLDSLYCILGSNDLADIAHRSANRVPCDSKSEQEEHIFVLEPLRIRMFFEIFCALLTN